MVLRGNMSIACDSRSGTRETSEILARSFSTFWWSKSNWFLCHRPECNGFYGILTRLWQNMKTIRKANVHVGKKSLSMRHQAQKGFQGIFVGIPQHQKGYLVYVPHTRKIIYSYNVVFDVIFSSALAYTSHPYAEAMDMRPDVSYIPYDTSSRERTGNIITFTHFEEGNLLSETHDDTESGNESDDNSTMPPLISEE